MEIISNGPAFLCNALDHVGIDCAANVFTINVWHILLFFALTLIVSTVVASFRRYGRLDRYENLLEMTTPYGAGTESRTLRVHPHDLARALDKSALLHKPKTEAAKWLNERYGGKYFVVEIHERGRKILSKELKVTAWWHRLQETEFQTDPVTLEELKRGSESVVDDDTDDSYGADGRFDIYFRPVRWWDLRHWLNHPAREIRFALYVAIFAATLEYSSDIIDLFRALFRTP